MSHCSPRPCFVPIGQSHGELCAGAQGRTTATWIPSVVFTVLTFVTGLMALLLPETLNRPLPETIEEIESWTRSLVPRGPRLTGDGSAQVHELGTTCTGDESLQVDEDQLQDVDEENSKPQQAEEDA